MLELRCEERFQSVNTSGDIAGGKTRDFANGRGFDTFKEEQHQLSIDGPQLADEAHEFFESYGSFDSLL